MASESSRSPRLRSMAIISPGPSLPLRVMRSAGSSYTPASEATRKWRSDVSIQRAGRRPLRSSMAAA